MEIVINACYGDFSVSKPVYEKLGLKWDEYGFLDNQMFGLDSDDICAYRASEKLISVIKELGGDASSGELAKLQIVTVPDDIKWHIVEHEGYESIHENHRVWC